MVSLLFNNMFSRGSSALIGYEERLTHVNYVVDMAQKGKVSPMESYSNLTYNEIDAIIDYAREKGYHYLYDALLPMSSPSYVAEHKGYSRYRELCKQFPKNDLETFVGLEIYPLIYKKLSNYERMVSLFQQEVPDIRQRNQLAYRAFLLFETPDKFLKFVERNRKSGWKKPLITSINNIRFPSKGEWRNVDFRAWGNVFLRFGLNASNGLFLNASPYTSPSREGKSISLKQTWLKLFELQEYSGLNLNQANQLVDEVERWGATPSVIKTIFDILSNKPEYLPPFEDSIPEIEVDGEKYNLPGTNFKKLSTEDMRIFFIGKHTGCCEWVGGNYSGYNETPRDVYETRESEFYVVEDNETQEILAHSWVWRSVCGDIVFDGFEAPDGSNFSLANLYQLLQIIRDEFQSQEFSHYKMQNLFLGKCGGSLINANDMFSSHPSIHAKPIIKAYIGANVHDETAHLLHLGTLNRGRTGLEHTL